MNAFYNKKIAQQLLYVVGGLLLCVQAWAADPVTQSEQAAISGLSSTTKGYDLLAGNIRYSVQDIAGPLPFIRSYQATLRSNIQGSFSYNLPYFSTGYWTNNYTNSFEQFNLSGGVIILGIRVPGSRSPIYLYKWEDGIWGRINSTAGLYSGEQDAELGITRSLPANMSIGASNGGWLFKYKGIAYQGSASGLQFTSGLVVSKMTQVSYPDGKKLYFSYDSGLNMTGVSDSFGNKLTFELQATETASIIKKVTATTASGIDSQVASYVYGNQTKSGGSKYYYITSSTSTMGGTQTYGYTTVRQPAVELYWKRQGIEKDAGYTNADVLTRVSNENGVVQQKWEVTHNYVFATDGKSFTTAQLTLRTYRPLEVGPVDDFTTVYDDKARTMTLTTKPDGVNATSVVYTTSNTVTTSTVYLGGGYPSTATYTYNDDSAFSIAHTSGDYPGLLIGGKPLQSAQMDTWRNRIKEAFDRRGAKTIQETDGLSRVTSQTITPAGGGTARTATYTYGSLSNNTSNIFDTPTTVTQNYGSYSVTSTHTINSQGQITQRVMSSTQPSSITKTYTYEYTATLGQLLKTTGPRSTQSGSGVDDSTTYTYYSNGDLKDETRWRTKPNGTKLARVTQYSYNSAGQPVFVGYENQDSVVYSYDSRFRKTKAEYGPRNSSLGLASVLGSQTWTYDVLNQVTQSCDQDNVCTNNEYDFLGRLIKTSVVNGTTMTYEYWPNGITKSETSYNASNSLKLKTVTLNILGQVSRLHKGNYPTWNFVDYSYDLHGNVTKSTTTLGIVNSWTYDGFDRVATHTDGNGKVETKSYDLGNNLLTNTDPLGQTFSYSYKNGNQTAYSDTNGLIATTLIRDAADNIISTTSPTRSCTVTGYNEENLPSARDCQTGGQEYKRVNETYTYADVGGKLTSADQSYIGSTAGEGVKTDYSYDTNHRLIGKAQLNKTIGKLSLATAKPLVNGYAYTVAGRLSAIAYPSGMRVSYVYDTAGRVSDVYYGNSTMLPVISAIKYEGANRLKSWLWGDAATGVSQQFEYLGFLPTEANYSIGNENKFYLEAMLCDRDGRVTGIGGNELYGVIATLDGANRIIRNEASAFMDERKYSYDQNGNRLSKSITNQAIAYGGNPLDYATYVYTGNRLSTWNEGGTNKPLSFKADEGIVYETNVVPEYDGAGRRRVDTNGSGVKTWYEYNHQNERTYKRIAGQAGRQFAYDAGRLIGEYDAAGNAINEYIYLGDKPIAVVHSGKLYRISADYLNTPRFVIDPVTNDWVWRWSYREAFGAVAPEISSSGFEINLRFPGMYADSETGLFYNMNRYYNPQLGRYMEPDPIGLEGGLNPYEYAKGNPTMYTDPSGLFSMITDMGLSNIYVPNSLNFENIFRDIERSGRVTQEQHYYGRQMLNDNALNSYGLKGRSDITLGEMETLKAKQLEKGQSIYHTFGAGNENNLKYVFNQTNGRMFGDAEIVLRPNNNGTYAEVTQAEVMGTYNFGGDKVTHFYYDVVPYWKWGNSPSDTTSRTYRTAGRFAECATIGHFTNIGC